MVGGEGSRPRPPKPLLNHTSGLGPPPRGASPFVFVQLFRTLFASPHSTHTLSLVFGVNFVVNFGFYSGVKLRINFGVKYGVDFGINLESILNSILTLNLE